MKNYYRFISICLAAFLLLTAIIPPASANSIQPRYQSIRSIEASLTIGFWGMAKCQALFTVKSATPVRLVCSLQVLENGSWNTVKSWTETGTTMVEIDKSQYVASGYTYRVYAVGYAYDSNNELIEHEHVEHTCVY